MDSGTLTDKPMSNLLKRILVWLGLLGVASAAGLAVYAPPDQPAALDEKLCITSATGTHCTEQPKYNVSYFGNSASKQVYCLALRDSDGDGYTYITANNGALATDAATCRH